MKKYLIYLFTLASTLLIGCDSFRDMSGTAEVMGHRTKRILRIERKEYQTY